MAEYELVQDVPIFNQFKELSQQEIMDIIMKSPNKSCCLDPVPTELLKKCIDILIKPITAIVNKSLLTGSFPDCWKCALVIPLLKKLDLDLISKNYRPVSNLPFVAKIIEKSALPQFVQHLQQNGLYSTQNSAYKEYHSTETLLVKVYSDIMNSMDRQQVTILVLLDLSAAFDTVDLEILSVIFQQRFNISGTVRSWFFSYLRDREQRIIIKDTLSEIYRLKYGVPQGSCAGPVVFLGYLSSLYDIIERHAPSIAGYADDTQLYLSFNPSDPEAENKAVREIEDCIQDIRAWMLSHKLKLNDDKTELLIIGSKQQLAKVPELSVKVGSADVNKSNNARNLGVIFDSNMNLEKQVNNISKRAFFELKRIRQIRHYLSQEAAEQLVHSFVSSAIDYCNSLMYGCTKNLLNKLQKIQNCAARVVTGAKKFDHVKPILESLHWLPVSSRIEYKIALLTYKCLNELAPQYLADLLVPYKSSRQLRSFNKSMLKVPKTNTKTFGSRAFTYAAPTVWNALPEYVKKSNNVESFKKLLKPHYFKVAYGK